MYIKSCKTNKNHDKNKNKKNEKREKVTIRNADRLKWPNSKKKQSSMEQSIVTTYPLVEGRHEARRFVFQGRRNVWSCHQLLFEDNVRKIKKMGLRILRNKDFGVVYAPGRYQHPMRPSQGMTTFNQICKIMTSN